MTTEQAFNHLRNFTPVFGPFSVVVQKTFELLLRPSTERFETLVEAYRTLTKDELEYFVYTHAKTMNQKQYAAFLVATVIRRTFFSVVNCSLQWALMDRYELLPGIYYWFANQDVHKMMQSATCYEHTQGHLYLAVMNKKEDLDWLWDNDEYFFPELGVYVTNVNIFRHLVSKIKTKRYKMNSQYHVKCYREFLGKLLANLGKYKVEGPMLEEVLKEMSYVDSLNPQAV